MVKRGNPRNRRQGRQGNRQLVTKAQLKRENHLIENGMRFNPPPHPPDFMAIPWFNLVVRVENFTSITFGIDATNAISLYESIRTQLNLSNNDFLEYRVQNVRIWSPLLPLNSGNYMPPLRAIFWSIVPNVSAATGSSAFTILEQITAYPDQVSRAAIGFTYPKSQQSVPIQKLSSGTLVTLSSGAGDGNVAYVKLLWRPRALPSN